MIGFVLAYLGGALTIINPCILPVLPFVFARSDKPFVNSGLPMLAGMAATFAAVATPAAVGGGWAVRANEYGRSAALALLASFGVTFKRRQKRLRDPAPNTRRRHRSDTRSCDRELSGRRVRQTAPALPLSRRVITAPIVDATQPQHLHDALASVNVNFPQTDYLSKRAERAAWVIGVV